MHAHEGYSTHFVCLCMCVSAVFWLHQMVIQYFDSGNRLYAKRRRFQFTDLSGKASFESYSIFFFAHVYNMTAIPHC